MARITQGVLALILGVVLAAAGMIAVGDEQQVIAGSKATHTFGRESM